MGTYHRWRVAAEEWFSYISDAIGFFILLDFIL